MPFSALIIGDEILSGRRADRHLVKLIELLRSRGLKLSGARYVGDEPGRLVECLRESFHSGDVVFSFGGIGATPDDHTRQAAARALGVELALHPEAEAAIRGRFGNAVTPHRLQMGVFPSGSEIIPNPYNQIPGFSVREHYFVPGFPVMAWPMVEWVLDTRYGHLHHAEDYVERSIVIHDANEGQLIELMERVESDFPLVTLFSLPTVAVEGERRVLELGVKGARQVTDAAMTLIQAEVGARGFEWQTLE
ncbi:MAG: competence/damage-inducible protein A [Rhodocyclaceae bacterium]|jgi:molybdopterin-biosynthesis enzyme MoeA-like protein|nr:competence/damage-inducible protein A [Rhodocyclaceae bacterium]MCL4756962.1 competence/damage-inducible protein A [Rhodocyclaceae bacterium]